MTCLDCQLAGALWTLAFVQMPKETGGHYSPQWTQWSQRSLSGFPARLSVLTHFGPATCRTH
eukprot:1382334-Amphidinium_carterae.2